MSLRCNTLIRQSLLILSFCNSNTEKLLSSHLTVCHSILLRSTVVLQVISNIKQHRMLASMLYIHIMPSLAFYLWSSPAMDFSCFFPIVSMSQHQFTLQLLNRRYFTMHQLLITASRPHKTQSSSLEVKDFCNLQSRN